MGRKKSPIKNDSIFCYYCEKFFDTILSLKRHQKELHFRCDRCNKSFDSGPALRLHTTEVHKANLTRIPRSISGRESPLLKIKGMVGIPGVEANGSKKSNIGDSSDSKVVNPMQTHPTSSGLQWKSSMSPELSYWQYLLKKF